MIYYCLDCNKEICKFSAVYGTHRCRSCSSILKNSRPEVKEKISKANTGKRRTKETRNRISKSLKGRIFTEEHRKNLSLSGKAKRLGKWEELSYRNKHQRFVRIHGKADRCESYECKRISKLFEWANISNQYKEDRSDWKMLCRSCHRFFDLNK